MEIWLKKANDCKEAIKQIEAKREQHLKIAKECLVKIDALELKVEEYNAIYWRWKHGQSTGDMRQSNVQEITGNDNKTSRPNESI
jgi:hypothetical protein